MTAPLDEIDSLVPAVYETLQEHVPFVLRAGLYITAPSSMRCGGSTY